MATVTAGSPRLLPGRWIVLARPSRREHNRCELGVLSLRRRRSDALPILPFHKRVYRSSDASPPSSAMPPDHTGRSRRALQAAPSPRGAGPIDAPGAQSRVRVRVPHLRPGRPCVAVGVRHSRAWRPPFPIACLDCGTVIASTTLERIGRVDRGATTTPLELERATRRTPPSSEPRQRARTVHTINQR
jgi:hypothetical protein